MRGVADRTSLFDLHREVDSDARARHVAKVEFARRVPQIVAGIAVEALVLGCSYVIHGRITRVREDGCRA